MNDIRPTNPTVEDIIQSRQNYIQALAECNEDKAALRRWSDESS